MPDTQEVPNAEQAEQAVTLIQTGRRATMTVANAQASGGSTSTSVQKPAVPDADPAWWTLGRKVGAFTVGCAVILGTVFAYLALHR